MTTLIFDNKCRIQQLKEARGWIADCGGGDECIELSDEEVVKVVDCHYYGGWQKFEQDFEHGFIAD